MKLKRPCCPTCGEPARYLQSIMLCHVPLERDANWNFEPRFDLLRRGQVKPETANSVILECGGGHCWWTWKLNEDEDEEKEDAKKKK
jgi:hypothetical protein